MIGDKDDASYEKNAASITNLLLTQQKRNLKNKKLILEKHCKKYSGSWILMAYLRILVFFCIVSCPVSL